MRPCRHAGTHRQRIAEAAKVIENTQRDLNIALMNELAIIFDRLGIDTGAVLAAAATKWNFLPFRPGLVGGHCIGVDPYYLTHKAQEVGYHPAVILAGRRINDGMGRYVADQVVRLMLKRNITVAGGRVLVLGLTFKENCPDMRNTKVTDIISTLADYNVRVDVYDPWVDGEDVPDALNRLADCRRRPIMMLSSSLSPTTNSPAPVLLPCASWVNQGRFSMMSRAFPSRRDGWPLVVNVPEGLTCSGRPTPIAEFKELYQWLLPH